MSERISVTIVSHSTGDVVQFTKDFPDEHEDNLAKVIERVTNTFKYVHSMAQFHYAMQQIQRGRK